MAKKNFCSQSLIAKQTYMMTLSGSKYTTFGFLCGLHTYSNSTPPQCLESHIVCVIIMLGQ